MQVIREDVKRDEMPPSSRFIPARRDFTRLLSYGLPDHQYAHVVCYSIRTLMLQRTRPPLQSGSHGPSPEFIVVRDFKPALIHMCPD
jgi:hypothetical protein